MNKKSFAVSLLISLFVIACGGSGGGSTSSSGGSTSSGGSSGTPGVAPTVTGTSPVDGATDADPDSPVTATFSEDMLNTSIDNTSFTLSTPGGAVASTVTFDGATNVATLTPDSGLKLLQDYTANLSGSITDLDGDALAATSWSFTTRDGVWGSETQVSTDFNVAITSHAHPIAATIDDSGNAMVLYYKDDQYVSGCCYRANYYTSRYTPGSGWSTERKIDSWTNTDRIFQGAMVGDANGNVVVVYQFRETDGTTYNLKSIQYAPGSGWSSPQILDSNELGTEFALVKDNSGYATLFYTKDQASGDARMIRYQFGTGWGTPMDVSSAINVVPVFGGGDVKANHYAVSDNGNMAVIWDDGGDVWINRYTVGSGWGTAATIPLFSSRNTINKKHIAIDGSDNLIIVWSELSGVGIRFDIWATRYTSGTGWSAPELIENDDSADYGAREPFIAMNDDGTALVVWEEFNSSNKHHAIGTNRYVPGSGWATSEKIVTAMIYPQSNVNVPLLSRVVMDSDGNAFATWYENDTGSDSRAGISRYVPGTGWFTASLFDNNEAYRPLIYFDNRKRALAIYYLTGADNIADVWAKWFE